MDSKIERNPASARRRFCGRSGMLRVAAVGALLMGVPLLLGACSSGEDSVAALQPSGKTTGNGSASQRDVAKQMIDCLADNDLAASPSEIDDAEHQLEVFPADQVGPWQVCWNDGCFGGGTEGLSDSASVSSGTQFDAMAEARVADKPVKDGQAKTVFAGSHDWTDTWRKCERETGYRRPSYATDPSEELLGKQATAKAGIAWADCARKNGYPSTKDPQPPVADDYATVPTALLPATITPDQLRILLKACPILDKAAHAKADDAAESNPELLDEDYWAMAGKDPVVGFDVPCMDGSATECEPGVWEKYHQLDQVLEEPQNEYLRERNQGK